jgi:uncharacterized protein
VPKLGPKTFEQAAGFLRIRDAENPLDASAVHPESYHIVDAMARDLNCSVGELMRDADLRGKLDLAKYTTDTVGLPTLKDIMAELAKPGRDPREQFEAFSFAEGIGKIEDVKPGMKLPGVVTNITAFGAFRYRRAPGRPRAHQPAFGPLHQGPERSGEGASEGDGHGA